MTTPLFHVGEIADQLRGVSYGKTDAVAEAEEGYLPVLRAGNITDSGLVFDDLVFVPAERVSSKQRIRKGDVVIAASSGSLDVVGKAAMAKFDYDGGFGAFCKVLRPNPAKVEPAYFAHYFQTREYRQKVSSLAAGANINNLKNEHLDDLLIPLPPLPEQRRIAAILDQADVLRAKRREALAQLDSLTQSIFIEMFGDPVANPKRFPAKTLGEIIKFEGGSQPPASTFSSEEAPDRIRLVQIRDFKSDRFKTYIPRKLSKRFFDEDDVMIGRYGPPVFQILRGLSGSYNVALMKALPRDGVTKDFVFHLLKEERLHNFVVANSERTAGQSGVNLELLEKYQAYLPPIELQIQFSKQMAQLKTMAKSMSDAQDESNSLFASLQHRAFRGEL